MEGGVVRCCSRIDRVRGLVGRTMNAHRWARVTARPAHLADRLQCFVNLSMPYIWRHAVLMQAP